MVFVLKCVLLHLNNRFCFYVLIFPITRFQSYLTLFAAHSFNSTVKGPFKVTEGVGTSSVDQYIALSKY